MKYSKYNLILGVSAIALIFISVTEITGFTNISFFSAGMSVLNLPSIGIVLGGVLFHAVLSFPIKNIREAFSLNRFFTSHDVQNEETYKQSIGQFLSWQREIKKNNSKARKDLCRDYKDTFEGYVLMLTNTNYSTEEIKKIARTKAGERYNRNRSISNIYYKLAEIAPAFGMLGTLIGLIMMLSNFESVSELGRGLSFALMTTLYGLILSHVLLMPMANKSDIYGDQQYKRDLFKLNAILLINEGKEPIVLFDHLCANREGFTYDEELKEQLNLES